MKLTGIERSNMKTHFTHLAAALTAAIIVGSAGNASASSHRDAPSISNDPAADNTDLWAWHTGTGTTATLHIVASYIPFEEPSGGPNFHTFSDDVLYQIHVARGDASLDDVVTYQIKFATTPVVKGDPAALADPIGGGKEFFSQLSGQAQTYSVTEVTANGSKTLVSGAPVAPPNVGPRTNTVAYNLGATTYPAFSSSATFIKDLTNGGKAWAGPRDDGFFVDLGGVFDLANFRAKGTAKDTLSQFNTHTISLDIPADKIPPAVGNQAAKFANRLGVWASASRRKVKTLRNDGTAQWRGPWVQVSRVGLPLINEVLIGLQDKDKYNYSHPKNDVANFSAYLLNPVIVRDAEAVGIYAAMGIPGATIATLRSGRIDIVNTMNVGSTDFPLGASGDVLRVDLDLASGFPNGRPIVGGANTDTDVTDVLTSLVIVGSLSGVSDGVQYNDANYLTQIPYLAAPWEGLSQGHGSPTP